MPLGVLARPVQALPSVVDGAGRVPGAGHLGEDLLEPLRLGAVDPQPADLGRTWLPSRWRMVVIVLADFARARGGCSC